MIAEEVCERIPTAEVKIYRGAIGLGFVIVKLELGEFSFRGHMLFPLYYHSAPNPFICHPGDRKWARDYRSKEEFQPSQNYKKIFCRYQQEYKMSIYFLMY